MADSSTVTQLVSILMQLGLHGGKAQAFMLVGKPGVGKTMGIEAVAQALGKKLNQPFPAEIWSGPQIQAEDAAGLPVPDLESGTTRLLPLRLGDKVMPVANDGGGGVLCIDEFGSLSPSQEAAFLNLLQGGRLGERTLPNSVALGAMMNPEDHASNARALSAPAANRFVWLDWDLDVNTWLDYMRGGRGFGAYVRLLPEDWEARYGEQARSIIASYIKRNPTSLLRMPPPHDAGKAWASPRSWEAAARLLGAVMATGERKESDLASLAVEGCVGQGEAESFMKWLVEMNLPDPEELLADPENAPKLFPKRNDQLTVTMESVAQAAMSASDKFSEEEKIQRYEAAWEILAPVFNKKNDVGMPGVIILALKPPKGAKVPMSGKKIMEILKKANLYHG